MGPPTQVHNAGWQCVSACAGMGCGTASIPKRLLPPGIVAALEAGFGPRGNWKKRDPASRNHSQSAWSFKGPTHTKTSREIHIELLEPSIIPSGGRDSNIPDGPMRVNQRRCVMDRCDLLTIGFAI